MYILRYMHACIHTYCILSDTRLICISIAGIRKTKMPTSSGVSGRIGGLGLFVFRRRTTVIGSSHGVTALAFGSLWCWLDVYHSHPMFIQCSTHKNHKKGAQSLKTKPTFWMASAGNFAEFGSVYPELKLFRVCPSINPPGYLCAPSSWEEAAASLQLTLWQFLMRPIDVFPYVKKQQHLQWVLWHWERPYLWLQPDDIDMLPNSSFQSLWYFTAAL